MLPAITDAIVPGLVAISRLVAGNVAGAAGHQPAKLLAACAAVKSSTRLLSRNPLRTDKSPLRPVPGSGCPCSAHRRPAPRSTTTVNGTEAKRLYQPYPCAAPRTALASSMGAWFDVFSCRLPAPARIVPGVGAPAIHVREIITLTLWGPYGTSLPY
jgi:hypothetical protein